MTLLRHIGLRGRELERAQAGTIRLKLLKVGAPMRVSVRRVVPNVSAASPKRDLFARIVLLLSVNPANVKMGGIVHCGTLVSKL